MIISNKVDQCLDHCSFQLELIIPTAVGETLIKPLWPCQYLFQLLIIYYIDHKLIAFYIVFWEAIWALYDILYDKEFPLNCGYICPVKYCCEKKVHIPRYNIYLLRQTLCSHWSSTRICFYKCIASGRSSIGFTS